MKLVIDKDRKVYPVGTWGTKNENDYEILEFEFPAELEDYNKRIVYYLGDERVWDTIVDNKVYITNAVTQYGKVKAYVWLTKENTEREADTDFRTQLFEMQFYDNDNADGIVPTPEQVDGFNTMLTEMNNKIAEVNALEQTIETAESTRQTNETTRQTNEQTRQSNEATRQNNEQTRQTQEADRERRTDEAIADIEDKTAEYNANAEAKTTAFNNNATQKTNEFNSNYTQKVNDFNTNATTQKTDFNSNASSKTSAFNSNAETKTNTFNTNATNKTNAFNSNATEKTTVFDNNASTKTSEFNTNAESKTSAFNDNATSKTNDFNDNATEKTTAYNTNAQEKIDEYDEHIVEYQAQIDELQEEVEELSENMPWNTTEQATEIDITDAAKYSKNKMKVFGNTEQTQYSGKNFFHVNDSSAGWGTLTFALVNNIINISIGDGNGGLGQNAQGDYTDYNFDTSKDYYFSIYQKEGDLRFKESATSKWFRAVIYIKYSDDTTSSNYIAITTGMQSKNEKITFTEGKTPVAFAIGRYSPGNTLENNQSAQYYVQLEQGNTATDYEPYTGGVPSPNPDYPQDIHVVTGNNSIGVQGKNLLEGFELGDINSSTGATSSSSNSWRSTNFIAFDTSQTYYFSTNNELSINKIFNLRWYNKDYEYIGYSAVTIGYFHTTTITKITSVADDTPKYFKFRTGLSSLNVSDKVMVATSPATDYEPYYHAEYPVNLGNIELCKIGDYQDYLYKENGNWYKYGAIEKYVYNNDLTYNATSENYISVLTPVLNIGILSQSQLRYISYCNMFTTYSINDTGFNGTTNSHKIRINISFSYATTLAEVKALCEEKSLSIYYGAETPTSTQITDATLISQLDAIYEHLQLQKGINNITVTPGDIVPYMKLNYMQDLPSKLSTIESRLSALEE